VRFEAVLLQLLASGSAWRPWDCEAVLKRLLILPGLCWVSHRSQFARAIFARAFDGVGPERLWERRRVRVATRTVTDCDGGVLHGWSIPFGRRLDLIPVLGNEGIFFAKGW
jgi:hypothetical protein